MVSECVQKSDAKRDNLNKALIDHFNPKKDEEVKLENLFSTWFINSQNFAQCVKQPQCYSYSTKIWVHCNGWESSKMKITW